MKPPAVYARIKRLKSFTYFLSIELATNIAKPRTYFAKSALSWALYAYYIFIIVKMSRKLLYGINN